MDSPQLTLPRPAQAGKTISWASSASTHDPAKFAHVDNYMNSLREQEKEMVNGGLHFFQLHRMVTEKSNLFRLMQKLPKGGLLHVCLPIS